MYPGTFVEASKKHLPDTPLKCNIGGVTVQCLREVVAITFRKAEAWMPERTSMRTPD